MAVNKTQQEFRPSSQYGFTSIFQEFFKLEASAGILLLLFSILALVWANSPWSQSYFDLWTKTYLTIGLDDWALSKPIILWINDGLMAIFFFVVGLEIKREVLAGELSSLRKAALPIAGAVGGMLFPALAYVAFNAGSPSIDGWGVPMATDIAFTLGVLALLGSKAPLPLKVFVTALAIVDDIGAVLVIAFFYTADLSVIWLAVGGGILLLLAGLNVAGVKNTMPYAVLGFGVWLAILYSGIHATIAGVLVAMTIPARAHTDRQVFLSAARQALKDYEANIDDQVIDGVSKRQAAAWALEIASDKAESPLMQLEHSLHPWVSYLIMPIFALANAGVNFTSSEIGSVVTSPVTLGILFGLAVGKPLGITLMSWIAVRLGIADMPGNITIHHIIGASFLAGIGFTMALFIANLAFIDESQLNAAKIGILAASALAGIAGYIILRRLPVKQTRPPKG